MPKPTRAQLEHVSQALDDLERKVHDLEEGTPRFEGFFPEALVIYKADDRISDVNSAFEQTFGWKVGEVIGQQMPFIPKGERTGVLKQIRTQLDGQTQSFRTGGINKAGEHLDLVVSATPLKDSRTGKPGYAAGLMAIVPGTQDPKMKYAETLEAELEESRTELKAALAQVEVYQKDLEDLRRTTKILIQGFQDASREVEERIAQNYRQTVLPVMEKLKTLTISAPVRFLLDTLDANIRSVTSAFGTEVVRSGIKLSPRQLEICRMIKAGMNSREIAEELDLSTQTIIVHRKNIRKKLGLHRNKQNLASYIRHNM